MKIQTRWILGSVFLIGAAVSFQNCSQTEFDSAPVSPANVSANSSLDEGTNICAAPIPASFGMMACANGLLGAIQKYDVTCGLSGWTSTPNGEVDYANCPDSCDASMKPSSDKSCESIYPNSTGSIVNYFAVTCNIQNQWINTLNKSGLSYQCHCNDFTSVFDPNQGCVNHNVASSCPTVVRSWTVGEATCSGTLNSAINGGQNVVIDGVGPDTGSLLATCNNGTWTTLSAGCVRNYCHWVADSRHINNVYCQNQANLPACTASIEGRLLGSIDGVGNMCTDADLSQNPNEGFTASSRCDCTPY